MQLTQSTYLLSCKVKLKQLIDILDKDYQYVSVLASDVTGKQYRYSQRRKEVSPYGFGERGFVVRVYNNNGYQEYSFNEIDDVAKCANKIKEALALQDKVFTKLNVKKYETPVMLEEKLEKQFASTIDDSVINTPSKEIMDKLQKISDEAVNREFVIECQATFANVTVNKMFLSKNKDLMQSYSFVLSTNVLLALKNERTNYNYTSASGFKGVEIIDEVSSRMDQTYADLMVLFDATNIEPGEYTVICSPEASGLIAHEAFGHGLEMDMFVKERAVAKYHMNEMIASAITDMYDGTDSVNDTASYYFDDEGVISSTTQILKKGYLVNGMSDALSALRLGVKPSGNGRRESFERKAYTRMTNTYFGEGTSTLEEMIASTEYGFLIDGGQSGMEDPKHWGIQCVLSRAKEIKDGKLTGKVFTPVILTGYVPDLLANISMVSKNVETNGNGYCGKGHKEWVVVSDGGPYIKTKVRLG